MSSDDDADVEVVDPPRKRTRSQTKAAASAAKGKGKAKASTGSTRGRRNKKVATPPPVEEPEEEEEEKEEEERSRPESEDRDTIPPSFRPLPRVRLGWEHYPRDESGERIPYVETEHEAREREHLEFLSRGPTPLYGLNGDMVAMGGPSSDDELDLAKQAEAQERHDEEEAMRRHITRQVRDFHERLQFEGGDEDDALEWPSAGGSDPLPGWSHLSTPEDDEEEDEDDEEEDEQEEKAEELEIAEPSPLPSPPQPSPAPPSPQPSPPPPMPTRYPTPDWLKDGPTGPRPAGLL